VAMRDVELYRRLLGIEAPWEVKSVDLSLAEQRVDVVVGHGRGVRWRCPECGAELSTYDHAERRAWRHLDSCGFTTWLHARPPRVSCPAHGVRQVALPWAEPHARFTALFERLAVDVLKESDISGACRILRISWDEGWHLMERAVARGMARKQRRVPALVGVDEKAAAKGHRYLTLVCDLERSTVEHIADERTKASLDGYFQGFSEQELAQIRAVAMDMWEPYISSVCEHLPDAEQKIVFDRFHIMKHMVESVDTVRKREHRALVGEGLDLLTGSKYLWLYSQENLPERHKERFAALKATNLKTGRAWAIKESLRVLWHYRRLGWARRFWKRWYFWATPSRLQPVIAVARMLKRHLQGVLNYFSAARITNAAAEGLNSKIQTIKKMAYGYRNREHFKTAIFFHCGGLQLYPTIPLTHGNPG
jgi:transposase